MSENMKWNSVSFYFGGGPVGINHNPNNNSVFVDQGPVFGFGFSQRVTEEFHAEFIGITNETLMCGVKYEF